MNENVTVKVPATSANMGPGFDCLGMALDVWNSVEVQVDSPGFEISGEGAFSLPQDETNLVYRCLQLAFAEAGRAVPPLTLTCRNEIPLGRGLGSSSAAVVGGLVAGNELCGRPLGQEAILELAAGVEGHPDNVAPALLGGCQIVVRQAGELITMPVPIPEELNAVVFIPEVPMATHDARKLLPTDVSREDAVYNLGRVALLTRALATGDLAHLAPATSDRLHQPAREALFPPMRNIFRAALGAGALGVFLSGAGSSVLALVSGKELTIGYEMAEAAAKSGVDGVLKITRPSMRGAHVAVD